MSREAFERYADRREAELWKEYQAGDISQAEYNAEMRELQREGREAYQEDCDRAIEAVHDEWGW